MGIVIQMIGIAAMLGSVLSFQCNKHKSIMILQIIATALFGIQYYLLGAFTAMALNTVSFSLTKPKLVRSTILISSPLLLVYNILTGSWGGVINEAFSEVSSIVGLLRYDMKKKKGEPAAKESGVE